MAQPAVQPTPQAGLTQVTVAVTQSFGGQSAPIVLAQDGALSAPFALSLR